MYTDSQSCEYKEMNEPCIQYLTLQQCTFFYYGQFTLSVLTNLTATDHFSSTIFIKTNEGHMLIGIHYKLNSCALCAHINVIIMNTQYTVTQAVIMSD